MEWTNEQKQAIEKNGANLLVSAGAGSGKTTILIARIINKIINEKINVDDLLVVTFTDAAQSEMKDRLINKLYEKIEKNPSDTNLRKQISLVGQAHISTIHSFCLDVIRNNFYETNLSANFRVADKNEIEIIKQDVMEEVFESKYEEGDENFIRLLNLYTTYKDDKPLKDLIYDLHKFLSGMPRPKKWIENAVNEYNTNENDFFNTSWGKTIKDYVEKLIDEDIKKLNRAKILLANNVNLIENFNVIEEDLVDLESINFTTYDSAFNGINKKVWEKWPSKNRKLDENDKELKDEAKKLRDSVSNEFKKVIQNLFYITSSEVMQDINKMYPVLKDVMQLEFLFEDEFQKRKLEKNIIDYSDIEHIAYNLLVDESGNKTHIAEKYDFNEIMIDEYQDSSLIQEEILNSVSNGHNIFMVGDVKQSIYRFRQAKPELFLKKYETYKLNESSEENITENEKVLLYKNFRSRRNILDFVNCIFDNIMSKELGEINYNEEEYLNAGASFEDSGKNIDPELYIIQKNDVEENDYENEENQNLKNDIEDFEKSDFTEETETQEEIDKNTLQARFIATKIKELVNQGYKYGDITILLKSPSVDSPSYEKELIRQGIPVFADIGENYLQSIEIDTVLSVLKIIDNPLQDIPLVTVMRSMIGGFTDNDLIEVRLQKRNGPFYYALKTTSETENENIDLKIKCKRFIELIENYRELSLKIPIDELIWKIITETGYYYYVSLMPNGKLREANLRKLFEKARDYEKISLKGIFNFITFIEKVEQNKSNDITGAKIINENDDVVRIMSIHKSKGLEFNVVFVSSIEKGFNYQDMKPKIVYDQDLGIGVNFVSEGIDYKTITKDAINLKAKKEKISEEMRVFYVALTRAKERLILVGFQKDVNNELTELENELSISKSKEKIDPNLLEKKANYLSWIEMVYKYDKKLNMQFNIINKSELKEPEDVMEDSEGYKIYNDDLDNFNKNKYNEIDKTLNYKYPYDSENVPSKTSVTALKMNDIILKGDDIIVKNIEESKETQIEKFIDFSKEQKLTSAEKGTLIHLTLQKLNDDKIEETINNLKITREQKEFLKNNKHVFENYLNSKLYDELKNAKEIHKEETFYLNIKNEQNVDILLQGIIDLYYINSNDELILVDYKTDRNVDENTLKERYKNQLMLYKNALEKYLNKKVYKTIIYSTFLNKEVIF